jgi:hypothetical protein
VLRSVLPTQLAALTSCFEEYLVQSSDEKRLSLLARLHRLRNALPDWPGELTSSGGELLLMAVISWRVMDELLVETSGTISQITPARSVGAGHSLLLPLTASLRRCRPCLTHSK